MADAIAGGEYDPDWMVCTRCHGTNWICRLHPWSTFPHESCRGPSDPCPECNTLEPPRPPARVADRGRAPAAPGLTIWTLKKDGRRKRCELRDDSRHGAGVDVQVFEGDAFEFSQRCPNQTAAQQLAASIRQGF